MGQDDPHQNNPMPCEFGFGNTMIDTVTSGHYIH